jgi:two-component system, chemotaxis family, chemotaxis protein CheY
MRSLVIDDEFVALAKMASMLATLGESDAATNGEQALDLFIKALKDGKPYDLITIDINMPDMNGLTLLGRLHAEEKVRNCPKSRKIIVTAESRASNVRAALACDCDGFLVKPVRRATLLEKLTTLNLIPSPAANVPAGES